MQCRECGFNIGTQALFCPACGTRLVTADPQGAPQGGVQSPVSFLGADATQVNPIIPSAVRPARPAPVPPSQTFSSSQGAQAAHPSQAAGHHPGDPAHLPQGAAHRAEGAAKPPASPLPAVQGSNAVASKAGAPKGSLPQPGDTLGDRYRVEKFLGQGSLSNAYLCRDLKAGNREVVLKAMHARKAAEPGLADSFLFLADSISKYDHRGIAKTFESGRMGDTPYYTMEWVSGTPLRMWLMERLTFENRVLPGLGLLRSLLETFETIHERGCYGSLKPENVFVTLSGPVVMDFGVVGFLSPQEFEFNSYARRYLPYMAPELRQDWSNLIPHSDYYSLGAILYEVLAGRAPTSPLRLPSELSDLFGIEADEIILKAMAPKPLDRFGTLEAFRGAVESLQAALLASPGTGGVQPGSEGSRSMLVASDALTVHNPDESFSTPEGFTPPPAGSVAFGSSPGSPASFNGNAWTREPAVDEAPQGPEASPYPSVAGPGSADQVQSEFAGLDSREGEAAHALRRFVNSPRSAFPDGEVPVPVALESDGGEARSAFAPVPGAWEAPGGETQPAEEAVQEEPVPAWLWIAIALAGCCMVVLSAYFGILLPR